MILFQDWSATKCGPRILVCLLATHFYYRGSACISQHEMLYHDLSRRPLRSTSIILRLVVSTGVPAVKMRAAVSCSFMWIWGDSQVHGKILIQFSLAKLSRINLVHIILFLNYMLFLIYRAKDIINSSWQLYCRNRILNCTSLQWLRVR